MSEKIKVVIDPGHGGKDNTNGGILGYKEAVGVLSVGMQLKVMLESTGKFEVHITRQDNKTSVTLSNRYLIDDADIFISLHSNAGKETARGSEVFYSVKRPEDAVTAKLISSSIAKAFNVPDRGAKTRLSTTTMGADYYTVLYSAIEHGAKHAFIVESLFHSNVEDERILIKPENLTKIAQILYTSIMTLFDVKITEEKPMPRVEEVSSYAVVAQKVLVELGITSGEHAKQIPTREEVWVMLHRLIVHLEGEKG